MKRIQSALISVYHKHNLEPLVALLDRLNVTIYSTGGTQKHIEGLGVNVVPVEAVTGYPSILGGRVKTLHPKVFGGILARRDNDDDLREVSEYEIPVVDLVIVDLYPFEDTVATTNDEAAIIEKIDIGGIALIRAAAKNYKETLIISHQQQYMKLLEVLLDQNGSTTIEQRKKFALEAFHTSSHYDSAIFNWFANKMSNYNAGRVLRYGENPHQSGVFHGDLEAMFDQLNGKALSYNNLVDIDGAVQLVAEFEETCFAILKHTNSCGLAVHENLTEAYKMALAGDPISAFGGILCTNKIIDLTTAQEIHKLFCEVVIAPNYEPAALDLLKGKKNRVILKQKPVDLPNKIVKTVLNGILEQDKDNSIQQTEDLTCVTKVAPTANQTEDLLFANIAAKHLKSNTIVLAKGKQLLGMGCGQTSRIDALKQAIDKANRLGFDLQGAVMASDAFFPFPDCVEEAHKAGIVAVIQPAGSKNDNLSIACCDENGMAMVTTGVRHFKH
ncbi:UNVERIFIED_CONTAM: hypothetical protein GTU68_038814 [Idotea baltica]|nr:hypothetical protein [Idotea baltica]